ncbi:MAG TPA: hypothetical protein VHA13_04595, partial [Gammaproteobacteria bacterium]|nr:hypothetical protein [Gammaproteobacteria bacterium]
IKLALVKGNDKLLEFLLQNGSFPINTFIVNSNLNPILYCIENDKPESPKAGCLSVLIKHGASLQVKDSQGLPAAHRIIESPSLSPTLNEHAELTIINPRFYTTLIQDLQNYLTQENITELTKARIEKFIDIYSKTNNHLSTVVDKSQHASLVKEVSSLLRTKITALFKYFSQFNDTDIINAYAAYQEIATLYSDQLSAQEKRRAGLELKEFLKNANSENNFENSLSKEDILKLITSMTEKVKVKVQLLNASQQAQAKPNKRNANQVNKLNHELVAIDSKLEAEIKSKQQDPNSTEILKKLSLGLKAMQKGTKMIANMMQDIADSYKDVNANIESFNRTTKNMNFKDAKAHQIAKANKLQVAIKNHMEKEQALEEVTAYFRNALGDKINIQAQNEQPVSTEGKASEHGMFGNSNRLSLTDESSQNNLNLENTNLYNSRSG